MSRFGRGFPIPPHIGAPPVVTEAVVVAYVTLGDTAVYNTAGGRTPYLEATYLALIGTAYARLWDFTADVVVPDSTLSTTSATEITERSPALTLINGNKHKVQFGKADSDQVGAFGAHIIAE